MLTSGIYMRKAERSIKAGSPSASLPFKGQGPVSRKPRKLFGPEKPFSINLYLKTERCICCVHCHGIKKIKTCAVDKVKKLSYYRR